MLEYLPKRRLTSGLRLPAHKTDSTAHPIKRGWIPRRVILSTRQHRGPAAEPVVRVGQRVLRGETVAVAASPESAGVHASTSGHVRAIEVRMVPSFTSTAAELCIVIETDGENAAATREPWPEDRAERLARIGAAGIVGLGGAVYPTALKLGAAAVPTLVVNGAECEPYISCDDMLMRESAAEIVAGTLVMGDVVGARLCIIAIERDKPEAIDAMRAALDASGTERVQLAELPTIYPAGGERQLIEVLSGVEVPHGAYPGDIGFLCQNVGTAYAVAHVAELGEPLVSRIVTVAGNGVRAAGNVEVPIGAPIDELIELCGGYESGVTRLIHGGSMMGYALPTDDLPVTKATNCLIAAGAAEVRRDYTEWQCIRCGECGIACPVRLQPQDLLIASRSADLPALGRLGLDDCIECGCCDVICPSQIPLTEIFRRAKVASAEHERHVALSTESDTRYRHHEDRQRKARAAERDRQATLKDELGASADDRALAIRSAVERAHRRKLEHD